MARLRSLWGVLLRDSTASPERKLLAWLVFVGFTDCPMEICVLDPPQETLAHGDENRIQCRLSMAEQTS